MQPADKSPHGAAGTTLEELERFRQDIERYRARRKAVSEEFEGFVRGFKQPAPPAPASDARPRAAAPVPASPPAAAPRPVVESPLRPPQPPRDTAPAPVSRVEAAPSVRTEPSTRGRRSWIPLAVAALVVIALAAWWMSRPPAGPGTDAPATATAPAAIPEAAPPPVTPAPPPDPSESVLTTTRPVWLRVIADGNRVLGQELPAGARVPFKAEKIIEIRAGDAGAVRLSIGGRDQGTLGADGAVVTRSFTVQR